MKLLSQKHAFMLILSLSGTAFFSMNASSVEPVVKSNLKTMSQSALKLMDESDLDGVSAVTGNNILSIFGAPAAGLTDDAETDPEQTTTSLSRNSYQEGDTTNDFAKNELRTIEKNSSDGSNTTTVFHVNETAYEEAIHSTEEVIGSSNFQSTSTSSKVYYKEKNVSHKMTPINVSEITSTSDIAIDQFVFENLKGNNEHRPDVGDLYLSNFRAQTSTHIQSR